MSSIENYGEIEQTDGWTSYRWNFELSTNSSIKPGDKFISPIFNVNYALWNIILFPNGNTEENEGYISLFLQCNNGTKVPLCVSMSIMDEQNHIFKTITSRRGMRFEPMCSMGHEQFLRNELLFGYGSINYHFKGYVVCTIQINKINHVDLRSELTDVIESNGMIEIFKVNNFDNYLNNEKHSDFKFIIDGKELYAHRIILINRSEYFEIFFKKENIRDKTEETIVDVNYYVFYELMRFFYTGKISQFDKHAEDLLVAAERYRVDELKDACEKLICKNLTLDNVIDIIKFADLHNAKQLKNKAIDFVGYHGKELIEVPEFKSSIEDLSKDLTYQIICSCVRCHKC